MKVIINGETKEFQEKVTLKDIIKDLGLEEKVMAAAINMEIVKQDRWNEAVVQEGDKIELLDFVGGG